LFYFLATCARLSCILSFRVHVKLSYRIVSYRTVLGGIDNRAKCIVGSGGVRYNMICILIFNSNNSANSSSTDIKLHILSGVVPVRPIIFDTRTRLTLFIHLRFGRNKDVPYWGGWICWGLGL